MRIKFWLSLGFIVLIEILCHSDVFAQNIFINSLWESKPVEGMVLSMAYGDVDGDYHPDIVYVTNRDMVAMSFKGRIMAPVTESVEQAEFGDKNNYKNKNYKLSNIPDEPVLSMRVVSYGNLDKMASYRSGNPTEFHRIWVGDWDFDGKKDVLVNGFTSGRIFSEIYHVESGQFVRKHNFDTLVTPLEIFGKKGLYSQVSYGQDRWGDTLTELVYQGKWSPKGKVHLYTGVGPQNISLFALSSMGSNFLELTGDRKLLVRDQSGKKVWKSGVSYGSPVDFYDLKQRDSMGIKRSGRIFIPPRMAATASLLYLAKNEGYLNSVIGTKPNINYSQLVTLEWASYGFQERKVSQRFYGALTDLQLVDFDLDGRQELLMAFVPHKSGFLDAYGKQGTHFIVIPAN